MANQKVIGVEKFEGIIWKMESGVFQGIKYVRRKPFGDFTVRLKLDSTSGRTSVSVSSLNYEELNKEEESYDDFNSAISIVTSYFDEIDELSKNIPNEAKIRAEIAYKKEIARAIQRENGKTVNK